MTAYDLVLAGGTVVDPASGLNDRRDVGIAEARIAAIEPHLSGSDAADVLDVAGRYVVPGLVDLHAHVYPGVADLSIEADPTSLGRGVTTVVDAGSSGANTFGGFRRWVVAPAAGRVLAFLNISLIGQIDPFLGELHDLRFADPERAAAVALANADVIVGFKVRLSAMLAGQNGPAGLERALEAGRATGLPVMAHIGGLAFDLEEALAWFRPGDIVTHAYTGWRPGALVTDGGRVLPGALEARARGVVFDVGHGAGSFTWEVAEAALADGFRPDTISSDLHRFNVAGPVHDLVTTLGKFLALGLPLGEVIAMATVAPARALGPAGLGIGRLAVGSEADVTILALEWARTRLVDSAGRARETDRRLVPVGVVRAGRPVPISSPVTDPPRGIAPG
jgi:dihydroorotase